MLINCDKITLGSLIVHELNHYGSSLASPHVHCLLDRVNSNAASAELVHKETIGGEDNHELDLHAELSLLKGTK
jgi:hypothetical protein